MRKAYGYNEECISLLQRYYDENILLLQREKHHYYEKNILLLQRENQRYYENNILLLLQEKHIIVITIRKTYRYYYEKKNIIITSHYD